MKAGRELDTLVAEKVMGLKLAAVAGSEHPFMIEGTPLKLTPPPYSTDIAAAWRVVDHLLEMRGEDGHYHKECFIMNVAEDGRGDLVRWSSAHAAYIICTAALRAVGIEV